MLGLLDEEVRLGQLVGPVVGVGGSLQRVGAALQRDVDRRAGGVAAAGVEARGLDLELLHRAGRRHERDAAAVGHVRRSVERELVAAGGAAGDDARGAAVVERPRELEVAVVGDAGRQPRQRERVAVRQRHHRDRLLADDLPGRSGGRRQQRRFRGDRHRFLHPADVERQVDVELVADAAPAMSGRDTFLKPGQLRGHGVGAGIEEQDRIVPFPVGGRRRGDVGGDVGGGDGDARQAGVRRIEDASGDGAAEVLRRRGQRCRGQREHHAEKPFHCSPLNDRTGNRMTL